MLIDSSNEAVDEVLVLAAMSLDKYYKDHPLPGGALSDLSVSALEERLIEEACFVIKDVGREMRKYAALI